MDHGTGKFEVRVRAQHINIHFVLLFKCFVVIIAGVTMDNGVKIKKPQRPSYLPLSSLHSFENCEKPSSASIWFSDFKGSIYDVTLFLLNKTIRYKRTRPHRNSRPVTFPWVILFIMLLILFKLVNSPTDTKKKEDHSGIFSCHLNEIAYRKGQAVCEKISSREKYLSYQPPGGGWNNQRIALENAVVLAKLLNRTLIVHPLAPHREMLRLKRRYRANSGYKLYNRIMTTKPVPVSQVIDLKYLSHLLPVREFIYSHNMFIEHLKGLLTWRSVCHNGLLGVWVDRLPPKTDIEGWHTLQKAAPPLRNVPYYRQACVNDTETSLKTAGGVKPMWGILDELSGCEEEMLYFQEGSLFFHKMLFTDKQRALDAHAWILKYIRFPPSIVDMVREVVRSIGSPYNAVHVRRSDHPSRLRVTAEYWTERLSKMKALMVSSKLYVATDEKDRSWFRPFRELGYNLIFSDEVFPFELTENKDSTGVQDILGIHEQLLCAHAEFFVGSFYSTFTMYIQRLRDQASWQGGFLNKPHMAVSWIDMKKV